MCEDCGCGQNADKKFEEKVQELIEAVRPNLQAHGGDIEFVGCEEDKTVKVRLQGACSGCPGARMTLKNGVERVMKEHIPEVKEVVAVD